MNKVMMQYFEWNLDSQDQLWNQVTQNAQRLKEIGIDVLWLPPAYKGIKGLDEVGYGVYDLYDLGEFDQKGTIRTKYGTKDEYLNAIKTLHQNHIEVIGDIVLNHKMGADGNEDVWAYEVNKNNRNEIISKEQRIKASTLFRFENRHQKYSSFTWNYQHFNGVDYDAKSHKSSDFLFKGKSWDIHVDNENGNFDYLMGADIDLDNQEVIDELIRWGIWYFRFTNIDGVRLDAVKHMSSDFYKNWLATLRKEKNNDFFAVGEYWHGDVNKLVQYLNHVNYSMSLFDVPLHYHFYDASRSHGQYDMRNIFEGTLVKMCPQNTVTFVDNHDTQLGQSLESMIEPWFKPLAYALILLRQEGYPCVFYGDYYGLNGYPYDGCRDMIEKLLFLRKTRAIGKQYDYFDKSDVIGWTRENGLAVILSIQNPDTKKMYVGQEYAHFQFYDDLGNVTEMIEIDEDGYGIFKVNGESLSIYVPECKEGV